MPAAGPVDWMHVFIDVPPAHATATREFWSQVLGWPVGEAWDGHPEFRDLEPPHGDTYVHVQEIDAEPRVHVDIVVDDIDAARDRIAGLGAALGTRTPAWQVMRSPGGLPFCLCRNPRGGSRPTPTRWPGGHRSRLAQVCLDIPDHIYAEETAFWERVTGWTRTPGDYPQFTFLTRRSPSPLQVLLQRLEANDTATAVRAHLDLGSSDVNAETQRVRTLGARLLKPPPEWAVLEDPAGLPFCVTPQSPDYPPS